MHSNCFHCNNCSLTPPRQYLLYWLHFNNRHKSSAPSIIHEQEHEPGSEIIHRSGWHEIKIKWCFVNLSHFFASWMLKNRLSSVGCCPKLKGCLPTQSTYIHTFTFVCVLKWNLLIKIIIFNFHWLVFIFAVPLDATDESNESINSTTTVALAVSRQQHTCILQPKWYCNERQTYRRNLFNNCYPYSQLLHIMVWINKRICSARLYDGYGWTCTLRCGVYSM